MLYHKYQTIPDIKKRRTAIQKLKKINQQKPSSTNHVNSAGRIILEQCRILGECIGGFDNSTFQPYKTLNKLVAHHNIRILVFKHNKLKMAFPAKFDGSRIQIALLETVGGYISTNSERCVHVDFICKPEAFFKKNYQCILCLKFKTKNRRHDNCVRFRCKYCRKLMLQKNDYFNYNMTEFCLRKKNNEGSLSCSKCKKKVPAQCLKKHMKICARMYDCPTCGKNITGLSPKNLKKAIEKHNCHTTLCKICHIQLKNSDLKSHACTMQDVKFQNIYNRMAYYDIGLYQFHFVTFSLTLQTSTLETLFGETDDYFQPILIVCEFESVLFGNYSRISFSDQRILHTDIGKVENDVAQFDYTLSLPNKIAPLKLPQRFGRRSSCWPKNVDPDVLVKHYNLNDEGVKEESISFSQNCWVAYKENLRTYSHLDKLKNNCIFHFLCFFISPCFYNTSFLAHNGTRFDSVLIQRVLLDMDIVAKTITIGSGLLEVRIIDLFNCDIVS